MRSLREVRLAHPGALGLRVGADNVFFWQGGALRKAAYGTWAERGQRVWWVDGEAEVVSTRPSGPSSAEVLAAVRRPLGADFAEIPPSVWADPHPAMRVEPVINVLADYDPGDYAELPPSVWGARPPAAVRRSRPVRRRLRRAETHPWLELM